MLHSEQQRHIVMETATTLHHRRGRIHPRAGRWKRGAIQGRFPCAGTVLSLQAGIYLSASAVIFFKWELLWYLHLDPKTKSEKQDQLEYKSLLRDMLSSVWAKTPSFDTREDTSSARGMWQQYFVAEITQVNVWQSYRARHVTQRNKALNDTASGGSICTTARMIL